MGFAFTLIYRGMTLATNKAKSQNRVGNVIIHEIIVRRKPGCDRRCLIRFGHLTFEGCWGKNGSTIFKKEGDGKTPIGTMNVLEGFYRDLHKYRRTTRLPMSSIHPSMGWCDAPNHPNYNRLIKKPFQASHETMLRQDQLYDYVIVLDWNILCRQHGRGSAIFLHIAKGNYAPTEGCIAISKRDMLRLISHLRPGQIIKAI